MFSRLRLDGTAPRHPPETSVHVDSPRFAGHKIIKRILSLSLYPSFCACVQEPSGPPAWDTDAVLPSEETWPA